MGEKNKISFQYDGELFEITQKFINYLPRNSYLSIISKEFKDKKILEIERIKYTSADDFEEYLKFLSLEDFEMTTGFLKILDFDQGITNIQKHPLDYLKIKIKEDLIRDTFYQNKYYKDPYFKLIKLNKKELKELDYNYASIKYPKDRMSKEEIIKYSKEYKKKLDKILNLSKGNLIIAGGSVIAPDKTSDIDIFILAKNEKKGNEIIKKIL